MQKPQSDLSVRVAARQVGRSQATVRSWIKSGKVTQTSTDPIRVSASDIRRLRSEHLAMFDGVSDIHAESGPSTGRYDEESRRLRELLRSVLASVENFDEGVAQLRRSQRIVLDAILPDLSDAESERP